jgi:hypothetical protein
VGIEPVKQRIILPGEPECAGCAEREATIRRLVEEVQALNAFIKLPRAARRGLLKPASRARRKKK